MPVNRCPFFSSIFSESDGSRKCPAAENNFSNEDQLLLLSDLMIDKIHNHYFTKKDCYHIFTWTSQKSKRIKKKKGKNIYGFNFFFWCECVPLFYSSIHCKQRNRGIWGVGVGGRRVGGMMMHHITSFSSQ